ncbi:hypothetical protein [Streptomyces sp. ITFR-6]|uniref:hypothetical protein n=1 Tax=Streptomyces sp. ITFR-6 TaxID=3075197 RepID=UPI0028899C92|nr:hypothetical protein [Streptomyces sp. ITFR-6]WNI31462.1 hypothetical protein RLT59_23735 [Streptomyces sp. ITFR-6]
MTARHAVIGGVIALVVLLLLVLAGCMKVAGDDDTDCDDEWFALVTAEKPAPPRPAAPRPAAPARKAPVAPVVPAQPDSRAVPHAPSVYKPTPTKTKRSHGHRGHHDLDICDD